MMYSNFLSPFGTTRPIFSLDKRYGLFVARVACSTGTSQSYKIKKNAWCSGRNRNNKRPSLQQFIYFFTVTETVDAIWLPYDRWRPSANSRERVCLPGVNFRSAL